MSRYEDIDISDDSKPSQRQPATAIGVLSIDVRKCDKCKGSQAKIDTKARSTIWYCGVCDIYEETTVDGAHLRFFLQKPTVVTIQGQDER